jgi:hypothetical protein
MAVLSTIVSIDAWFNHLSYLSLSISIRFPKDTVEEQIAALTNERYVTHHFLFHNAFMLCMALTAFSLPDSSVGKKLGFVVAAVNKSE